MIGLSLIAAAPIAGARRLPNVTDPAGAASCVPTIVIPDEPAAWKATQPLALQMQRLIQLSVADGVQVLVKSAKVGDPTLELRVDRNQELTSVKATLTHGGSEVRAPSEYPTAIEDEVSPYFALGLMRELAFDWETCERRDANASNAAAYAMVRAATAADLTNADHAFDLETTALAIDPKIAAGYVHLSQMLQGRGEPGWSKIAAEKARSIDPEALAYLPEVDPVPALRIGLADAKWRKANTGLEMLSVADNTYGLTMYAWKVDPMQLDLSIKRAAAGGEKAGELLEKGGGVFSINGGFFKEERFKSEVGGVQKILAYDGLLALGDKGVVSDPWSGGNRKRGGILTLKENKVRLIPSAEFDGSIDSKTFAIQSKPMMIEPGGKFAMNFDDGVAARRTAVCTRKDGSAIFVVIDAAAGKGITLYQLARLLSSQHSNNQFDCDAALALDGAVSSQASYVTADGRVHHVPGRDVPYAIIANVPRRDSVQ
jgi:uncharacterized protein YigE (DUF2233 family)